MRIPGACGEAARTLALLGVLSVPFLPAAAQEVDSGVIRLAPPPSADSDATSGGERIGGLLGTGERRGFDGQGFGARIESLWFQRKAYLAEGRTEEALRQAELIRSFTAEEVVRRLEAPASALVLEAQRAMRDGSHARALEALHLAEGLDPGRSQITDSSARAHSGRLGDYILGMQDGTLTLEGFFEPSTGGSDTVLARELAGATVISYYPAGDSNVTSVGYGLSGVETMYEVTTAVEDASLVSAEFQSASGMERVYALHALTQVSGNGNGTGVDKGSVGATAFGAHSYLHVTQIASGTLTVKLQHSPDNAAWADLITHTATTTVTSERKETATPTTSVDRYLRSLWTLTAGTATFSHGGDRRCHG